MRRKRKMRDVVSRLEARYAILSAANKGRSIDLAPLVMRHLNIAVFKVRQRGLVGGDVLAAAGFQPKRRCNR